MPKTGKLETTVGDLIVALTDKTRRQLRDDQLTYEVVALMLAGLMAKSCAGAQRR